MSLREVLIDELKDLYSAENQLVKQLPKTAKLTKSPELKQIFLSHLDETKEHVERLKQIFGILGKKATGKHCKGMEGAIEEVKEALQEEEEGALFDAGVIGGAARVEHYEIAGYTCAVAMAKQLGETEISNMLTMTLSEELNTSKLIMTTAKSVLKQAYAMEPDEKKTPEKKPKDADEKESEQESEKDEADAQETLKQSAEEAMKAASDDKSQSAKKSAKKSTKKSKSKK